MEGRGGKERGRKRKEERREREEERWEGNGRGERLLSYGIPPFLHH